MSKLCLFSALLLVFLEINVVTARQMTPCGGGGYYLPNNTCVCPAFYKGNPCKTMMCLNSGASDQYRQSLGRCTCPPGLYGEHCESQGCRPGVQKNLDNTKRSFVLIINHKDSMQAEYTAVVNNLKFMITSLTQKSNWIEDYIFTGYMEGTSMSAADYGAFYDLDEFVNYMNKSTSYATSTPQDHFKFAYNALQYSYTLRAHSQILLVIDSPPGDAGDEDFFLSHGTDEQLLMQMILQWRLKLTVIYSVITPSSGTPDFSAPKFRALKRLVQNVHGDLLVVDKTKAATDIADIMASLIPTYVTPENIYVSYDSAVPPNGSNMDFGNNDAYLLVTQDPINWIQRVSVVQQGSSDGFVQGYNFRLFRLSNEPFSVNIPPGVQANYRIYQTSLNSVLLSYVDDVVVDVGTAVSYTAIPMVPTAHPISSTRFDSFVLDFMDQSGNTILTPRTAVSRTKMCTFEYNFYPADNCIPGSYSQRVKFFNGAQEVYRRILPGYCGMQDYHYGPYDMRNSLAVVHSESDVLSCSSYNYGSYSDPRLTGFQQYIIAIENTAYLTPYLNDFLTLLNSTSPENGRRYTLILYDNKGANIAFTTFYWDDFAYQASQVLNKATWSNTFNNYATLFEALSLASQSITLPPAIVYVYTTQVYLKPNMTVFPLRRDMQVNIVFLTNDGSSASTFGSTDMLAATKQSNGRFFTANFSDITKLTPTIQSMIRHNQLLLDSTQDCTLGASIPFKVERSAQSLEFTIVGDDASLQVFDINDKMLPQKTLLSTKGTLIVNLVPSAEQIGSWLLKVTSKGTCNVQVHVISTANVFLGFTSDQQSDYPASQMYAYRGSTGQTYIISRVVESPAFVRLPTVTSLSATIWNQLDTSNNFLTLGINQRDDSFCAFSFISASYLAPVTKLTKFIISGVDGSGIEFQRTAFYYQPDVIDKNICNGYPLDTNGQCICPLSLSGEYCQDRVCVNGGTPSLGTCYCNSGYYGSFCQYINFYPNATTTAPPLTTTTIIPVTTSISSLRNTFFSFFTVMFVLILR